MTQEPDVESPDRAYEARVTACFEALRIPPSYGRERRMRLCLEATDLVPVGPDIYGRERQLAPRAAEQWAALTSAAALDGVTLLLVSAFRSLEYQRRIFERKLAGGQSLDEILRVNVPPGYSEHHTGRAVDVTAPGSPPLSEAFDQTTAFAWLVRHAGRFGFSMSYPRDNPFGVAYEPWHWAAPDARPEGQARALEA